MGDIYTRDQSSGARVNSVSVCSVDNLSFPCQEGVFADARK
jgi:hypothetical protein